MAREYDVMVAGHLCFDVIPRFPDTNATRIDEIMRPGKLVEMQDVKMSTGGPVSNTGINLKTLGNKVAFCARIGDDDFGKLTRDYLDSSGNAAGIHVVEGSASSYTVVIAPPGIDRVFLHHPGTNNEFGADDLSAKLIGKCAHFHFGYPPLMKRIYENEGDQLQKVFQIAKEAGATTSCDMALPDPSSNAGKAPWAKILEKILPYIDIFLPSVEEAFYMLEPQEFLRMKEEHGGAELIDHLTTEDYSRIASKLLDLGCAMTSLKSGHRGFYLKTKAADAYEQFGGSKPGDADAWSDRELWCPAFSAPNLASATGSGDSSIAGFLTAYFNGLTPEETLKWANCVGWQNVQELDAISGVHDAEYTRGLIEKKMPINDVGLDGTGWTWSEEYELWSAPEDRLSK